MQQWLLWLPQFVYSASDDNSPPLGPEGEFGQRPFMRPPGGVGRWIEILKMFLPADGKFLKILQLAGRLGKRYA